MADAPWLHGLGRLSLAGLLPIYARHLVMEVHQ